MDLMNKVALITGGASGMGEETAILFAKKKAKVAVADLDTKKGEEVIRKIKMEGGESIFIRTDVSRAVDVERMIDITMNTFKRLDILFNNAGIPMSKAALEETKEDDWERIININLKSMFLSAKCAVPFMKKQGGGVIINTASMGGVRPRPGFIPYNVSKGAVIVLTKCLAIELAPYNIRVNSISPGPTLTPMLPILTAGMDLNDVIPTIPLGKMTEPKDIAHAALFLASDESSTITGINLEVAGGRGI